MSPFFKVLPVLKYYKPLVYSWRRSIAKNIVTRLNTIKTVSITIVPVLDLILRPSTSHKKNNAIQANPNIIKIISNMVLSIITPPVFYP
jgi:hypothetical protein